MPFILEELYDKIDAADTMEQYQNVVPECIEKLETEGYENIADEVRVLSEVYINRFSLYTGTCSNHENVPTLLSQSGLPADSKSSGI